MRSKLHFACTLTSVAAAEQEGQTGGRPRSAPCTFFSCRPRLLSRPDDRGLLIGTGLEVGHQLLAVEALHAEFFQRAGVLVEVDAAGGDADADYRCGDLVLEAQLNEQLLDRDQAVGHVLGHIAVVERRGQLAHIVGGVAVHKLAQVVADSALVFIPALGHVVEGYDVHAFQLVELQALPVQRVRQIADALGQALAVEEEVRLTLDAGDVAHHDGGVNKGVEVGQAGLNDVAVGDQDGVNRLHALEDLLLPLAGEDREAEVMFIAADVDRLGVLLAGRVHHAGEFGDFEVLDGAAVFQHDFADVDAAAEVGGAERDDMVLADEGGEHLGERVERVGRRNDEDDVGILHRFRGVDGELVNLGEAGLDAVAGQALEVDTAGLDGLVQRCFEGGDLKQGDLMTLDGQVGRSGKSAVTSANDGNFLF